MVYLLYGGKYNRIIGVFWAVYGDVGIDLEYDERRPSRGGNPRQEGKTMEMKYNQKQEYLNDFESEMLRFLKNFTDAEDAKIKCEKIIDERKKEVDNAFIYGVDIGGLMANIMKPADIVYIINSEKIADGFYWLFKIGKKEKLFNIRF